MAEKIKFGQVAELLYNDYFNGDLERDDIDEFAENNNIKKTEIKIAEDYAKAVQDQKIKLNAKTFDISRMDATIALQQVAGKATAKAQERDNQDYKKKQKDNLEEGSADWIYANLKVSKKDENGYFTVSGMALASNQASKARNEIKKVIKAKDNSGEFKEGTWHVRDKANKVKSDENGAIGHFFKKLQSAIMDGFRATNKLDEWNKAVQSNAGNDTIEQARREYVFARIIHSDGRVNADKYEKSLESKLNNPEIEDSAKDNMKAYAQDLRKYADKLNDLGFMKEYNGGYNFKSTYHANALIRNIDKDDNALANVAKDMDGKYDNRKDHDNSKSDYTQKPKTTENKKQDNTNSNKPATEYRDNNKVFTEVKDNKILIHGLPLKDSKELKEHMKEKFTGDTRIAYDKNARGENEGAFVRAVAEGEDPKALAKEIYFDMNAKAKELNGETQQSNQDQSQDQEQQVKEEQEEQQKQKKQFANRANNR